MRGNQSAQPLGRRLYAWTLQNLGLPVWDRLQGRSTYRLLSRLEETQWWSPEAIEALQMDALRRLLTSAGERVPYYRELFAKERFDPRAISRPSDLAALPLLTREIVRERHGDLIDPAYRGQVLQKGTSGSTGAPLHFKYAIESEIWRRAMRLRGYGWSGFREALPSFHYWPLSASQLASALPLKRRLDLVIRREHFCDPLVQDEESMRAAVTTIRTLRPHVIIGYTQALAQWARFITEEGLRDWGDVPVICGAEAVLPGDRAAIARAFGPEVFDTYGSRETMLIAAECAQHSGLHLSEENLLVEIVHEGRPAPPGQPGDVVITDLHNDAMPFIRYANGDLATLAAEERCACGRALRRLERVEGRRADMIRSARGRFIPGILFNVLLSSPKLEIVRQFQVVQRPSGEVIFKVVKGREFSDDAFGAIVGRAREYLDGLPLSVEYTSAIPPGPSGKRRTVIVEPAATPAP